MDASHISMSHIIERYQQRRAEVLPRLQAFARGERPYLILQQAGCGLFGRCNTLEQIWEENINYFDKQLDLMDDSLPFLEPWVGTGAFANAFGCPYIWRENAAPVVHYRLHTLEELDTLPEPDMDQSPVMRMILDAIALFRERTQDQLPISITDTQSANDTATLVLDACEVMAGCYEDPARIHRFLDTVTKLIIDFTNRQIAAIGESRLARPGHIMVSDPSLVGISISDDNLAVVSAEIGREFCLAPDQQLADVFGGLAIHSCGRFQHLMPDIARMRNITLVDCAIDIAMDPNPNDPEAVRDAFAGSGIAVKPRGVCGLEPLLDVLPRLVHPDLKLILPVFGASTPAESREYYDAVTRKLDVLYG